MKVRAKITCYDESAAEFIEVESHWNRNGVLGHINLICGGKKFTVSSNDLKKAIDACTGL